MGIGRIAKEYTKEEEAKIIADIIQKEKNEKSLRLDLGKCNLTHLPDELFELTWLEELILSDDWEEYSSQEKSWLRYNSLNNGNHNTIKFLPLSIKKLKNLKKLIICGQKDFSDLTPLKNLFELQQLDIFNTQVTDLTPLKDLKKLQHLEVAFGVSDLLPLKELKDLRHLSIFNTQISNLTPLKGLTQLRLLRIEKTKVSDLTPLKELKELQYFWGSENMVKDLLPIKNLTQLEYIDVSSTEVSDLTPLKELTQLQQLYIRNTEVSDLTPLKDLTQLQQLYISNNEVSDLTPLKNLTHLQQLDISNTEVNDLTPLKELTQLQQLGLSSTKVNDLTPLKELIQLEGLSLNGSPIVNPPKEIVEQGAKAIRNYFKQIEAQGGTEELFEAKLIIVGEGGTGKTTLFNKLQQPDVDIIKNPTAETKGINVKEGWAIKNATSNSQPFYAHIWDFGGQELQYMTHQFFLTPRALYILMLDARKDSPNLSYWFKIMSLLGKDDTDNTDKVHLLTVFNKRENSTGSAPQYQEILKYYINDFEVKHFTVDLSKNDTHFQYLLQNIEESLIGLPIVKSKLPRLWKTVRKALKEHAKKDNYISQKEFSKICAQIGIKKEEDQDLLSSYLHKLGSILHFQEDKKDLMDTIFLNPQWVVTGVYAVLENIDYLKAQKGRFSADYIIQTLRIKGYDAADAQRILQLMTKDKFDICYESTKDNYVAAQLLPDDAPNYNWHTQTGSLKFRYQYPLMPKGLMSRLIVRLSEYIELNAQNEETVWKKGIVLTMPFEGIDSQCRILLQEDDAVSKEGLQQIKIEVMGDENYRRDALRRVRDEVMKIHKQWFKHIQFDEMIPCNCIDCQNQPKPELYTLKGLLRLQKNDTYKQCESGRKVSIISLLEGIYTQEELTQKEHRNEMFIKDKEQERNKRQDEEKVDVPPSVKNVKNEEKIIEQPKNLFNKMKDHKISLLLVFIFLAFLMWFFTCVSGKSKVTLPWGISAEKESSNISPVSKAAPKITVVGKLKINNIDATPEEVMQVENKTDALAPPVTLSGNVFQLLITMPENKIIELEFDLKGVPVSPSSLFKLPEPDSDHLCNLGLILIKKPMKGQQGGDTKPVVVNNYITTMQQQQQQQQQQK